MTDPIYIHLKPGNHLPKLPTSSPFKAVIIIEADVEAAWRDQVCTWLTKAGCLYAMTWGSQCSGWETTIDMASLRAHDFDVPDDDHVMTTSHGDEPLSEVFWFAQHCAFHATLDLPHTYLIHIAPASNAAKYLHAYDRAQHEEEP